MQGEKREREKRKLLIIFPESCMSDSISFSTNIFFFLILLYRAKINLSITFDCKLMDKNHRLLKLRRNLKII